MCDRMQRNKNPEIPVKFILSIDVSRMQRFSLQNLLVVTCNILYKHKQSADIKYTFKAYHC